VKRGHPLKRTRIKARGKRAEREAEALEAFKAAVYLRAGAKPDDPFHVGLCARCRQPRPLQAHHRLTNPRVHNPEQGEALCLRCHIYDIHGHEGQDWADWFGPKRKTSDDTD